MNPTDNKPNPSPSPKKTVYPGYYAAVILFLVLIFAWYDISQTKRAQKDQEAKNEQLSKALSEVQTELAAAREELNFFKTGDSQAAAKKKTARTKPALSKPAEEPETLVLQKPTVSQAASGIVARFEFQPESDAELPDLLTLVVRVPSGSEAKILSLKPADSPSYSNVDFLVNAKGNLGMIEGSPSDLKALVFELTVSEPVTATVRGSTGIKAFKMDITADGCTVRKL